ncbi:MAG: Tfp pilus assembly protein FimT/FimU [Weeksellaceae bacterium]
MKHGFTLIEIIVMVGIIGVFMGTGVVVYSRTIHKNNFTKDIDTVVDILHIAKQKTISRDTSGVPSCPTFAGYAVLFDPDNNRIVLEVGCGGFSHGISTYDLQNATFDNIVTPTLVEFLEPYGSLAADSTIRLKYPPTEQCTNVTISATGLIEKDPEPFDCI